VVLTQDIYSAGEMGLYYNLLPDRTLAVKDDSCKGREGSKEWLMCYCAQIWVLLIK
jgi:hypothetical protein